MLCVVCRYVILSDDVPDISHKKLRLPACLQRNLLMSCTPTRTHTTRMCVAVSSLHRKLRMIAFVIFIFLSYHHRLTRCLAHFLQPTHLPNMLQKNNCCASHPVEKWNRFDREKNCSFSLLKRSFSLFFCVCMCVFVVPPEMRWKSNSSSHFSNDSKE